MCAKCLAKEMGFSKERLATDLRQMARFLDDVVGGDEMIRLTSHYPMEALLSVMLLTYLGFPDSPRRAALTFWAMLVEVEQIKAVENAESASKYVN